MCIYLFKQFKNRCRQYAALALLLLVPSFAGTADSLIILPKNWLEQIYQPQPQISVSEMAMPPKKYAPRRTTGIRGWGLGASNSENDYIQNLQRQFPVLKEKLSRLNYGFTLTSSPSPLGGEGGGEGIRFVLLSSLFASFPTKWGDEIDFAGKMFLKPIAAQNVVAQFIERRSIDSATTPDKSGNYIVYFNAFPNTDVIYAAGPNEIEEFYYVKNPIIHPNPPLDQLGGRSYLITF